MVVGTSIDYFSEVKRRKDLIEQILSRRISIVTLARHVSQSGGKYIQAESGGAFHVCRSHGMDPRAGVNTICGTNASSLISSRSWSWAVAVRSGQ